MRHLFRMTLQLMKRVLAIPMLLGVLCLRTVFAQTANAPLQFEVASVKLHALPRGTFAFTATGETRLVISGNRLSATGTLLGLVLAAYRLRSFQVSGPATLPDQAGRDQLYDIEARAPGDGVLSQDGARRMLQSLLADRFQLKFHRESREMPTYDLVATGNPSKLKPSAPGVETRETSLPAGRGVLRSQFTNLSISELVIRLAPQFDRPLFDRTGLAGGYDFTLEHAFRPNPSRMSAAEAAAFQNATDPDGPTLEVALQQQLGLKIVPAKETVEILVVDHVTPPTGN